jgi:hypothetical protein
MYHKDQCHNGRKEWMNYVEQFAEENPRIRARFITRKVLYMQDQCAENKTEMVEEEVSSEKKSKVRMRVRMMKMLK